MSAGASHRSVRAACPGTPSCDTFRRQHHEAACRAVMPCRHRRCQKWPRPLRFLSADSVSCHTACPGPAVTAAPCCIRSWLPAFAQTRPPEPVSLDGRECRVLRLCNSAPQHVENARVMRGAVQLAESLIERCRLMRRQGIHVMDSQSREVAYRSRAHRPEVAQSTHRRRASSAWYGAHQRGRR